MADARRSPPTQRVVRIIDHVAAAGRRLGLSELARELDISKPTCLGIVNELVDTGYLVRDPRTLAYGPGPALMAAGRAAADSFAAVGAASRHLAELSARYQATCTVSAVTGDSIMVLGVEGPAGSPAKVGQRYPFAPPVGLMYVLWDSDEAFQRWWEKKPTLPVRMDHAHIQTITEDCRKRGYLVESLTQAGMRLHALMAGVAAYELPDQVRELVGEMMSSLGERVYLGSKLKAGTRHPVSVIAAPTFGADGRQQLVLTLYVGGSITGAEIERRGKALTEAADAVTRETGGIRRRFQRRAPSDSR